MDETQHRFGFKTAAMSWICEGYTIKISYAVCERTQGHPELWGATVALVRDEPREGIDFEVRVDDLRFGHTEYRVENLDELEKILNRVSLGMLMIREESFSLPVDPATVNRFSIPKRFEIVSNRDAIQFTQLYRSRAGFEAEFPTKNIYALDTALRRADPPFDGLNDLAQSLGLHIAGPKVEPMIEIGVEAPADLVECKLFGDTLSLAIDAHPNLDTSKVHVAVRAVPGRNTRYRHRVSRIEWTEHAGRKNGRATVDLEDANSAFVMLVVGEHTVRRQWIMDSSKAPNLRLVAMQTYDKELKRLNRALFESKDSDHFEQAVSGLAFLLGFNPVVPNETNAPDVIAQTPSGRLILIECTFRTSDIESKIGKLVDRREDLKNAMVSTGPLTDPVAVLVCRVPRQNIAKADSARTHDVLLVTEEGIKAGLDRTHFASNPDNLVAEALAAIREHAVSVADTDSAER
ncbi:hypothetical protein [Paraburkholderia bannensis]|uniref:hypothetical protein n=1 Tax=Paraburkholderia bannensis TaxID=765414 RepID=UPI002AC34F46|nr:hypothetical protein [Paraburkholderia bannensis]